MKLQNLISSHVSDSGRLRVCGASNGDRYTILNEVESGANIYNNSNGVVMSRGYNLSSDDAFGILTGPGDLIRTDPMLGPLQNNGGRTLTHALLPDSPAIDAGDPNFTPPPFFDQRGAGHPRVVNRRVDKGSFGGTKRKHAHTDGYGDSNSERHSHSYGYVYAYINTSVTDANRYLHSDAYAYG